MSVETSAAETDSTSADFMASVSSSEKQNRVSGFAISDEVVLETKDVNVYYGNHHALHDTSIAFHKDEITALIGPSGCGKSTFLRSLNLMNREIRGCRVEGEIEYRGHNINIPSENLYELRKSIGMVFQQPNPFHMSIYDNITFAPRRHGVRGKDVLDQMVEESLRGAALWDEVKDKLDKSAFALSGGQQQRLCIARTLAMHPDVILFDEPCSALDPISTLAIEDLMRNVVKDRAIVIVTHNMEQASRVSNRTAFFYMGDMVEYGETEQIFQRPNDARLNDYLTGMFS
ncbi:MAG: phosphate ABC transporter ATP-binding protein PstB [Collinsella bouchesdurhonensis]|nr:phosphate ABC transporter ATP-binding protein PstB [Collinsella bouchesdurhonensis]